MAFLAGLVPAVMAALPVATSIIAGAHTGAKVVRPATMVKDLIKSQGWDKTMNQSTAGKLANVVLGLASKFGYGYGGAPSEEVVLNALEKKFGGKAKANYGMHSVSVHVPKRYRPAPIATPKRRGRPRKKAGGSASTSGKTIAF